MHEVLSTIIFFSIVAWLGSRWVGDFRSSKRHLDIIGTRLSAERVEALFIEKVVRRRDACDYLDDGLNVQPPSRVWTLRLTLFPEAHGCAGRVDLASCISEPFPKQFPVTQLVRNGEGIASRKRAFKKALRREDPEIVLHEARSVLLPV